jgi:hypothetical protein
VCQNIIDAACELRWPRERLFIQILDDSTDTCTREIIKEQVSVLLYYHPCNRRSSVHNWYHGSMKTLTLAVGDQFPLLTSVASFAIDHPPGRVIFFFFWFLYRDSYRIYIVSTNGCVGLVSPSCPAR